MRKYIINAVFALFGLAVGITLLPALWIVAGLDSVRLLNNGYVNGLIGLIIFYLLSFLFIKPITDLNTRIEKYLNSRSPG